MRTNITDKNYKKLSLQVTLNGFSFCIIDTLSTKIVALKEIDFNDFPTSSKVEDHYWKAFNDYTELKEKYDEVIVLHDSNLDTFVPNALFDEEFLGSYLQYNTKVFETDFFAFDTLEIFAIYFYIENKSIIAVWGRTPRNIFLFRKSLL
jgi:hypothetical protein